MILISKQLTLADSYSSETRDVKLLHESRPLSKL